MEAAAAETSEAAAAETSEAAAAETSEAAETSTDESAVSDAASWFSSSDSRTPAEAAGAEVDSRVPIFTVQQLTAAGSARHAAFVCPSRANGVGSICVSLPRDVRARCTDPRCPRNGGAQAAATYCTFAPDVGRCATEAMVATAAFYRCPGSCAGAVLSPSLCYPIAASICEREDEHIFAVVGCPSCEQTIAKNKQGALALCGRHCNACLPVYTADSSWSPSAKRQR